MHLGRAVLVGALIGAGGFFGGLVWAEEEGRPMTKSQPSGEAPAATPQRSVPNDEELKKRLTAEQYRVTRDGGTEPPFLNAYWRHHKPGLYVDVVTGDPLFASVDKFDSGTGWPSFTKPITPDAVKDHADASHGMVRTEVRAARSGSHLGHVFDDGPAPTGLRYCINSAALRFIPLEELEKAGYGQYQSLFTPGSGPSSKLK